MRTWYVADALGSVRRTVSDAGAPLGIITYDPWGTVESGTVPTFGFTGELQQGGDVYLRARWYHAGQGRFASVDPAAGVTEQPYSFHPYQYAYADPVLLTDPSGEVLGCLALGAIPGPGWVAGAVCVGATLVGIGVAAVAGRAIGDAAANALFTQETKVGVQHTGGYVPPPYAAPPGTTQQTPGRNAHILSHPLPEEQYCPPSVFPLETPAGPYTSGPWEEPEQRP